MGKYGEIKEDFYTERTRILEAIGRRALPAHHHALDRRPGLPYAL